MRGKERLRSHVRDGGRSNKRDDKNAQDIALDILQWEEGAFPRSTSTIKTADIADRRKRSETRPFYIPKHKEEKYELSRPITLQAIDILANIHPLSGKTYV